MDPLDINVNAAAMGVPQYPLVVPTTVTRYGPDIKPYFTKEYYYVGYAVTAFALLGVAALGCKFFGFSFGVSSCVRKQ